MESHLRVEIVPRPDEPGYAARIDGAAFPIADFAVQTTESGTPMLSLILAPDGITIGEAPPIATPPPATAAPKVSTWGDRSRPDPRESIPGWQPERLGGQVAGHAEHRATGGEGGNPVVTALVVTA